MLFLGLVFTSIGNGNDTCRTWNIRALMLLYLGAGITTSLIALIANAGQTDQAIATAGSFFISLSSILSDHTAG